MLKEIYKKNWIESTILIFIFAFFMFHLIQIFDKDIVAKPVQDFLEGFTLIFVSIILEALPFIILGSFISSLIQMFVTEQTIVRIIPKNRFLGLFFASLIGLIFPVCECAIVPITRRLVKKGVPIHIAITFMMAVPIVNPIVLASTKYAFVGANYMVYLRGFLGFTSAILIGHVVGILQGRRSPLRSNILSNTTSCSCGHDHDSKSCDNNDNNHSHHHNHHEECCGDHSAVSRFNIMGKILDTLRHTSIEFYDVGKFLILGAFLSTMMQTLIPRDTLLSIGDGSISSILMMMILAFVLSICSESDAFIARTFLGQFTTGSIVGFLLFGPMIDIKNTIMLASSFKIKFVIKLISIIALVCFGMSMLVNFIGL